MSRGSRLCEQCGERLHAHACSPKWCSRFGRWSDSDRRRRPAMADPLVRQVLARFPGAEIVDVREGREGDV